MAIIRPACRFPESDVVGLSSVPLYRDQKAVSRVALLPLAVPVPCDELVTSVYVPPL